VRVASALKPRGGACRSSEESDFRSSGQAERRVPIGEEADVGLDADRVAVSAGKKSRMSSSLRCRVAVPCDEPKVDREIGMVGGLDRGSYYPTISTPT
jgi:hypothetical protein